RLARSRRHVLVGGAVDFVVNAGLGLVVGVAAFGISFGALVLAAAIYVSSSAITVKGLIDFRRLADDDTDLVLAILVAEDLAIGLVLAFVFGLSFDVGSLGSVGWLLAAAVAVTLVGKIAGGFAAGRLGAYTRRQSLNAGIALVAHGEFTVILAQTASGNAALGEATRAK